jgi:integrase
MAELAKRDGDAARALEFAILTAARSGEVRGATWTEVDLKAKVWTIPGLRMKSGKEHRVPLSDWALSILTRQQERRENDLIFPAPKGGQMSDMTLNAVMRRMQVDAVPHGFRSTFRDWAGEKTNFPRELAEQALAHTLESKVEAAYRRGDGLDKRRQMMSDWAKFIAPRVDPNPINERA